MSMLRYQPPLLDNCRSIDVPFAPGVPETLSAGDLVGLNGTLYTARDQTHRRLIDLLDAALPLPIDLAGQVLYYVGPTPARPGRVIGAAGPTTSYRMDVYTPRLLALGLKAFIGKGPRSHQVRQAMQRFGAVYMATIGGAGAFLSQCIIACELIAFPDLGPEGLFRLEVRGLPAIVINDLVGRDYYEMVGNRPNLSNG